MDAFFPYSESTDGVTVRVAVSYLAEQSDVQQRRWFWSYHIRIENRRDAAVQLLSRHWRITDGFGGLQVVNGDGVVGEQPVIAPGKAHDYVSGCPLGTPNGAMEGHYVMTDGDGVRFRVDIPRFLLMVPTVET